MIATTCRQCGSLNVVKMLIPEDKQVIILKLIPKSEQEPLEQTWWQYTCQDCGYSWREFHCAWTEMPVEDESHLKLECDQKKDVIIENVNGKLEEHVFKPQEDITASEISLLMSFAKGAFGETIWNNLPLELKRHFT